MIVETGYNFGFDADKCQECGGRCCIGESGYIWLNKEELVRLARHFNVTPLEFVYSYCVHAGTSVSIKEKPYGDGFACIFFDEEQKCCGIYELRPQQCRTFPFWKHFKTNQDEVVAECPGIVLF